MSKTLALNQFITRESFKNEFKEFCLKLSCASFLTPAEVDAVLAHGHVSHKMAACIRTNLAYYVRTYLPRYIAAFANGRLRYGLLHFGVNDAGCMTGIPWPRELGPLTECMVKEMVDLTRGDVFVDVAPSGQAQRLRQLYDAIRVQVFELEAPKNPPADRLEALVAEFDRRRAESSKLAEDYQRAKDEWHAQLRRYSQKMARMMRSPAVRKEVYDWAVAHGCTDPAVLQRLLVEDHDAFDQLDTETIMANKSDPTHIVYWIVLFREARVADIVARRPPLPTVPALKHSRAVLVDRLTPLQHQLLRHNPDGIRYYYVLFKLPGRWAARGPVCFLHPHAGVWQYRERRTSGDRDGPFCGN